MFAPRLTGQTWRLRTEKRISENAPAATLAYLVLGGGAQPGDRLHVLLR